MYRIEPYKMEHFGMLRLRGWESKAMDIISRRHNLAALAMSNGPAFSGFYKDEIVAVGGVSILWGGVGEAWIMGTDLIADHGYFFARQTKRHLDKIAGEQELHRIQATVQTGVTSLINFIEFCGFKFEARLERYGPMREDYLMFARLR